MSRPLLDVPVTVRWGDMDALGHVNNAVYSTYLEEARLRWFATLAGAWMDGNRGPVVAANTVNFRRPIEWPAELSVRLFAGRVGGSSLALDFRIVDRADESVTYADGSTVLVWVDRAAGTSCPLPEHVRQAAT